MSLLWLIPCEQTTQFMNDQASVRSPWSTQKSSRILSALLISGIKVLSTIRFSGLEGSEVVYVRSVVSEKLDAWERVCAENCISVSVLFHVSITFCFRRESYSAYPCYSEIRQLQCVLLAAIPGGNLKARAIPLIKGGEHLTPLCHKPQRFPVVSWVGFKVMALTFINLNGLA